VSIKEQIVQMAREAKSVSKVLANLSSKEKDEALQKMSSLIQENRKKIKEENKKDVEKAKIKGLSSAFIDRLTLNEKRIQRLSFSLEEIAKLEDPIGKIKSMWKRPNFALNQVMLLY